jgi:hypothetical protein
MAPRFSLDGARPNPSRLGLVVSFSLATAEPARIDALDIAGRRLRSLELDRPRPGVQRIRADLPDPLPPGLYHIRLVQGPRTASARAVVIR